MPNGLDLFFRNHLDANDTLHIFPRHTFIRGTLNKYLAAVKEAGGAEQGENTAARYWTKCFNNKPLKMKRRNFVKLTGASSLMLCMTSLTVATGTKKRLNILVLGGTNYLGPAVVDIALANGHRPTLFNRGITNPHLYPEVEKLIGDRNVDSENLSALDGNRKWDLVIDTWPADPRMVERTAKLLKGRTEAYAFISSIVVYKDLTQMGLTETAALRDVGEFVPGMSYHESKVLCERVVRETFSQNHLILRPPGIFGKRDESWSFVYWLWRIRAGGPVMAPGDGSDCVQWIDVTDVGSFMLHALESGQYGTYNTIGPEKDPLLFRDYLKRINEHYGNKAELVWVNEAFIKANQLMPIVDIPIWEPKSRRAGRHTISAEKAIAAGLVFTPMERTFESALNWYDRVKSPTYDPGLDKNRPYNGITREKELELLQIWAAKSSPKNEKRME